MSDLLLGPPRSLGSASAHDARAVNRRSVLHAIASGVAVTRADLARLTGLARPTISSLVDELSDNGLVIELGPGVSTGGDRPTLLGIDPTARHVVAIDMSVRPVVGVLADLAGTEHTRAMADASEHLGAVTAHLVAILDVSDVVLSVERDGDGETMPVEAPR